MPTSRRCSHGDRVPMRLGTCLIAHAQTPTPRHPAGESRRGPYTGADAPQWPGRRGHRIALAAVVSQRTALMPRWSHAPTNRPGGRWRLSRERQWRKERVRQFGRRRRSDAGTGKPRSEPRYRRLDVGDVLAIHRLSAGGKSARQVARRLNPQRDHKTVLFWVRSNHQASVVRRLIAARLLPAARSWLTRVQVGAVRDELLRELAFRARCSGEVGNLLFGLEQDVRNPIRWPSPCPIVSANPERDSEFVIDFHVRTTREQSETALADIRADQSVNWID
jgi:hypothetical protein